MLKREVLDTGDDDASKRGTLSAMMLPAKRGGAPHLVTIRYVDTMLLTPGRGGLAKAAELIGTAKVALPEGFAIDRMDLLLKADRRAFEAYALHDAEIALDYGLRMTEMAKSLGLAKLPSTLAGFGLRILRDQCKADGIDLDEALGLERRNVTRFNDRTGQYRTATTKEPSFRRLIYEEFGASAYHGGRGECYWFGPTPIGTYYDYDLPGAYTTAMAMLRPLDYDGYRHTRHLDDFEVDTVGAARVRFAFPRDTRFPCLPVRSGDNLYFPLTGVSLCTAPELVLARRMGASIEILDGVVIPYASDTPIFQSFTRLIQSRRAAALKGSLEAMIWKEIGNSLYGKTAQGVHVKRVFDPRRGRMDSMPPSPITSAWYASYVTGFIRAVLGEILSAIPAHRIVVSATTDGILTDAPLEEIDDRGPLCREFLSLRHRVFGTAALLEEKHRVAQVVGMKTRGQVTGEEIPGYAPVLAKAGVKPDAPVAEHNEYMLELFLNRVPGQKHHRTSLIGLREMWMTESDMVSLSREVTLNLEFDFKRKPQTTSDQAVRGRSHLAFDTQPWSTVEDAERARTRFRGWTRGHQRILRTREDFHAWQAYEDLAERAVPAGVGLRSDGTLGHLFRQFLRALVRDEWGLALDGRSYRDVADWLTLKGYECGMDDLKNAKRKGAMLLPRSVAADSETIPLLRVILAEFAGLDLEQMIVPDQLSWAREVLETS
ncbi:DNA polymerase [Aureimonas sp. AU12]|uniref:DNA polymerase n=1 Tax=Aureimonas sp. AU12 TaxID=1638161 RepID=UPI00178CDD4F|nr:DNA polymerase [Aureimonas sp. AU12]